MTCGACSPPGPSCGSAKPDSRARVKAILRWLWSVARRRVRAALTRSNQPLSIDAVNETAISRLLASDARATFVFAGGEMLEDELERWGRLADLEASPNITVERIAVVNHTLRPLWAQERPARSSTARSRANSSARGAGNAPRPASSRTLHSENGRVTAPDRAPSARMWIIRRRDRRYYGALGTQIGRNTACISPGQTPPLQPQRGPAETDSICVHRLESEPQLR